MSERMILRGGRVVDPVAGTDEVRDVPIVDRGESATSAAISTPRFMGPGCMTMAWPGSSAIRPASSP